MVYAISCLFAIKSVSYILNSMTKAWLPLHNDILLILNGLKLQIYMAYGAVCLIFIIACCLGFEDNLFWLRGF